MSSEGVVPSRETLELLAECAGGASQENYAALKASLKADLARAEEPAVSSAPGAAEKLTPSVVKGCWLPGDTEQPEPSSTPGAAEKTCRTCEGPGVARDETCRVCLIADAREVCPQDWKFPKWRPSPPPPAPEPEECPPDGSPESLEALARVLTRESRQVCLLAAEKARALAASEAALKARVAELETALASANAAREAAEAALRERAENAEQTGGETLLKQLSKHCGSCQHKDAPSWVFACRTCSRNQAREVAKPEDRWEKAIPGPPFGCEFYLLPASPCPGEGGSCHANPDQPVACGTDGTTRHHRAQCSKRAATLVAREEAGAKHELGLRQARITELETALASANAAREAAEEKAKGSVRLPDTQPEAFSAIGYRGKTWGDILWLAAEHITVAETLQNAVRYFARHLHAAIERGPEGGEGWWVAKGRIGSFLWSDDLAFRQAEFHALTSIGIPAEALDPAPGGPEGGMGE